MTLIAAYFENGVPMLVGDVLITDGKNDETHCKKIFKVSTNFVVGWTGRKLDAVTVLRPLFERFKNRKVSMTEVESFLLKIDTNNFLDNLTLIGWVVDKEQHGFQWFSESNKYDYREVHYLQDDLGFFAGSGSEFFVTLLKETREVDNHNVNSSSSMKPISRVLEEVCALTNGEYLASDRSWRNRFGFAYEILTLTGNEFVYVNDILFLTLDVKVNEDWSISNFFVQPNLTRYRAYGNIALVQRQKLGDGVNDVYLSFIGRGFDKDVENFLLSRQAVGSPVTVIPTTATHYCFSIRVINSSRAIPLFLHIWGKENDLIKATDLPNGVDFGFSPKFREILQNIILDNAGSK